MCGYSDAKFTEPRALEPVCEDYDGYEAQLELLPCPPHPVINEFLHPCFASDSELAKLAEDIRIISSSGKLQEIAMKFPCDPAR